MALQINYEGGGNSDFSFTSSTWRAQIFTTTSGFSIASCSIRIRKTVGSPTILNMRIRNTDGVAPPNAEPVQTTNLVSGTADISGLTSSFTWVTVTFAVPFALSAATAYAIVCNVDTGTVAWAADTANGYAAGNTASSVNDGPWSSTAGTDLKFRTYDLSGTTYDISGEIDGVSALTGLAIVVVFVYVSGQIHGQSFFKIIFDYIWLKSRSDSFVADNVYDNKKRVWSTDSDIEKQGGGRYKNNLVVVSIDGNGKGTIWLS